jgi:hypothetical protein
MVLTDGVFRSVGEDAMASLYGASFLGVSSVSLMLGSVANDGLLETAGEITLGEALRLPGGGRSSWTWCTCCWGGVSCRISAEGDGGR